MPTPFLTALALSSAAAAEVPVDPVAFVPANALFQEEAPPEPPFWKGSVDIGATLTSGNTDNRSLSSNAELNRRGEKDRWTIKGFFNFDEQESQVNQRTYGADVKYDHFYTEKLFLLALAGAQHDAKADLELRSWAGVGAGYQFIEREDLSLLGELAPTYFVERFKSDTASDDEYVALRASYALGYQITENTKFNQTVEAFPSLEDTDDFYGKADSKVRTNLSDNLYAQLQYVVDYDSTPAAGADEADHRLSLGVGWTF